jgi:hypothetical protein
MRTLNSTDLTALAVGLMAERDGETSILSVLATVSRLATFLESQGLSVEEMSQEGKPDLTPFVELDGRRARLTHRGMERFDRLTEAAPSACK